jgi:hypothetical protein
MTARTDLDTLLVMADPVAWAHDTELEVHAAMDELRQAVTAGPPAGMRPASTNGSRRRRRLTLRVAVVAVLVAAAGWISVLSLNDADRTGTAWGAELVRFAESSPLVLLDAPGWHVDYADEQSAQEGEMLFRRGDPASDPQSAAVNGADAPQTTAKLNWRPGDLADWERDRAASAELTTTGPVLGTTAQIYQYVGGRPGRRDITALWNYGGHVLEFRAGAVDVGAFRVVLAQLRAVDVDAWLSALPASVVKAVDRSAVIATMLRGIPLPPGFDASTIQGPSLSRDRYQLGAAVSGTVACTWFKRWAKARAGGDRPAVRAAIDAMATAKHWPVLDEMSKTGGYPEVLRGFAAAMSEGRWKGGDVSEGLGCTALGVSIP